MPGEPPEKMEFLKEGDEEDDHNENEEAVLADRGYEPEAAVEATPLVAAEVPPAKNPRKVRSSQKGTQTELRAKKYLEHHRQPGGPYTVHRCVRTGTKRGPFYVSISNDVFGCIDLVAKRRGSRTRWIQVTMHSGIGLKKEEIEGIPWDLTHDEVEIWRWVGGGKRRHKVTGVMLDRQFFQVYRLASILYQPVSDGSLRFDKAEWVKAERFHVRMDGTPADLREEDFDADPEDAQ